MEILVLYYSRNGGTRRLADAVCDGVLSVAGCNARLRTVPPVSAVCEATEPAIPSDGPPYAEPKDLDECDGLVLGSHFLDKAAVPAAKRKSGGAKALD